MAKKKAEERDERIWRVVYPDRDPALAEEIRWAFSFVLDSRLPPLQTVVDGLRLTITAAHRIGPGRWVLAAAEEAGPLFIEVPELDALGMAEAIARMNGARNERDRRNRRERKRRAPTKTQINSKLSITSARMWTAYDALQGKPRGAIKDLAARWGERPETVRQWLSRCRRALEET